VDSFAGPPLVEPSLTNRSVAAEFAATLESLIRLDAGRTPLGELVGRALARHEINATPAEAFRGFNIGRSIERSLSAGASLADDPGRTIPADEIPRDSTISPDDPRFRYEVIVRATSSDSTSREALITVTSDVPLSGAAAQAAAMQADLMTRQGRDYLVRIGTYGPEAYFEATVLSAARRD